jgi:MOSC domain-containing protein YiiM
LKRDRLSSVYSAIEVSKVSFLMPPPVVKQSLLSALITSPVRPGRLTWIGVRPERRAPLAARGSAVLTAGRGIEGDHYQTSNNGARQVTLIASEDLAAIAAFLGLETVDPGLLRRNFVTAGINLVALKRRHFRIGDALLEATGECAPCSRMEDAFGSGGYSAVRGRGGLTARILEGATVVIGAEIAPVSTEAAVEG